ncbi:MAG: LacI family DNA-binding transcriptional regulator [Oscillospiraceae bacterium]|nr:LacI family DNA-binding transcriptional regulator [Oscillospiraceae bacterium]
MANREKHVIGLLVDDIFADYTKEVVRSVYDAIPTDGSVRLVVLVGRYDDGSDSDANMRAYKTMYNTIYRFGSVCGMDGLIISLGGLSNMGAKALEAGVMRELRDIPKVFIAADIPDCTVVEYDNESGIRDAVDLLTNVYSYTRLCMLGGRDDNADAVERREIFVRCLEEKGLELPECAYVATDMSENCTAEAGRLLDANSGAQAIFCVNDAVAKGLYTAMRSRGLVPGKDIMVFGFDNTRMSGEMIPPLSSIGARTQTTGQRAVEMLLSRLGGEEIHSEKLPTRIYLRDSLPDERADFVPVDLIHMDDKTIYMLFDDCFYRYKNVRYDRERVDLRRLFLEITHRIQRAMERRFMGKATFNEITRMLDIFIDNGAMDYTDTRRLMSGIERIQTAVNTMKRSASTNVMINRLFLRVKDKLVFALSEAKETGWRQTTEDRERLRRLLVSATDYTGAGEERLDELVYGLSMLGQRNAALFLFDNAAKEDRFPANIRLRCVVKDGEVHIPSPERQSGAVREMFAREELPLRCKGFLAFPVFCGTEFYGVLACEPAGTVYDRGEFIADQLGRAVYMNKRQ